MHQDSNVDDDDDDDEYDDVVDDMKFAIASDRKRASIYVGYISICYCRSSSFKTFATMADYVTLPTIAQPRGSTYPSVVCVDEEKKKKQ